MKSAYIQFTRLEYFSIMQQIEYPLEDFEQEGDAIAFIEAIVRSYMDGNNLCKLKDLYEASRLDRNEKLTYYQLKSIRMA